jgi:hypothetical protein
MEKLSSNHGSSLKHNTTNQDLSPNDPNEGVSFEVNRQNPTNTSSDWQQVKASTNKRQVDDLQMKNVQKKYRTSSSGGVELHNYYDPLMKDNTGETTDNMECIQQPTEPKPPPLFVSDVLNVRKMTQVIETVILNTEYVYKCLANNKVRINPLTTDAYRKLVKHFTEIKVSFHTYQLKQDRAFRVVLKNMHFSNDPADISAAIELKGHKVRNVSNVKHTKTKEPLSMFFIDLEPDRSNKNIYDIEYLLNARVNFEPPLKKKEIVQCKKCQRYGHTKSYCWYNYRCVKCGQDHDTLTCPKKKSDNIPPKCVLCNGEHPANYKGCTVYQDLKGKSFPPLRKKPSANTCPVVTPEATASTHNDPPTLPLVQRPPRPVSPGKTYATVVSESQQNAFTSTNDSLNVGITMNAFLQKFETIMAQQAQQIGTLINLLTSVISKLK